MTRVDNAKFAYDVYVENTRVSCCVDAFSTAVRDHAHYSLENPEEDVWIKVTDLVNDHCVDVLDSDKSIDRWWDFLYTEHNIERAKEEFKSVPTTVETKDHINPKHYQDIVPGMQYMEMMQYMLPDVKSHLLGQVFKYLMRLGGKDEELQEMKKAKWYLDFLIAYKTNGGPIWIKDIPSILTK